MKDYLLLSLLAAALLATACSCPSGHQSVAAAPGALETSAKAATVQTVSGPVAGYVDDGNSGNH